MKKESKTPPKISPELYRALLGGVQIEEIGLTSCSAKFRRDKLGELLKISTKNSVRLLDRKERLFYLEHSYELVASSGPRKDFALKIECAYNLSYRADKELPEEFFQIFMKRNVPVNTWPYFREFVHNITIRMGLPPLTLPLLIS